ncbi:ABC transporter permease [Streptomyces sp. NPDC047043]|uniref:ABC transporter permease n=1 Tax=Streptomyces sp. NPDC047043 TaxID=3154497 RepID=UPI00340A5875
MNTPWRASVLGSQLAELLRRPGRLVTTGMSVLVAAFVVFATVMAQQITTNTTLDRFRGTPEAVSLVATAGDSTISGAALERIRALPGVAEAVGRVNSGAPIAGPSEHWLELHSDPGTGPLSQVRLVEGGYPDRAGQIAVNRRAAEELELSPGTHTTLRVPDPENPDDGDRTVKVTVTVTGVVKSTATAEQQSGAYTTDALIAPLADLPGYEHIDIRAKDGVPQGELSAQVHTALGKASAGVSVRSGSAVRDQEEREAVGGDLKEIFQLISVFLAVAVGAAALVATSTFRIVFAQRIRQLALLRAIGAPQRRLVTALAAEGALVGAVAGSLGVLLALGAGHLAPMLAASAGEELSAPGFPVTYGVLVVVGTVLVTVGAVLAPALSAARVSPLHALRTADTVTGERGIRAVRLGTGLLLAAAAAGLAVLLLDRNKGDDRDLGMMVVVASAGLAFLALIVLGPLLVRPVLAVAGWPLRRLGTTGRLAVSGVGGTPRRAAAVSVVVALGAALVSGALVCLACLTGYMERSDALDAPADFRITATGKGFDSAVVRQFAASPQLTHVTAYRTRQVNLADREFEVSDLAPAALPTGRDIDAATGSLADLGPGHAVIGSALAAELGLTTGDTLTLPPPLSASLERGNPHRGGRVELTVAATLPGPGPLLADVLVAPADLDRLGATANPNGILADAAVDGLAARGKAQRALESTIRAHVPDPDDVTLTVLAESRDSSKDTVRTTGITALGLVALTVIVAVVGVTATTSLTAIERTREFGLLRALGLGGNALRRTISLEAGLYGVLGGVLGLALGIPYAWLLIRTAVTEAPLRLPTAQLLLVLAGLAALTALAGLLPARRATRITPMAALGGSE